VKSSGSEGPHMDANRTRVVAGALALILFGILLVVEIIA
jgi:hypothetical protein